MNSFKLYLSEDRKQFLETIKKKIFKSSSSVVFKESDLNWGFTSNSIENGSEYLR